MIRSKETFPQNLEKYIGNNYKMTFQVTPMLKKKVVVVEMGAVAIDQVSSLL